MKITIEQIKEIIKEELKEIYKGKNRIIYAPDLKGKEDEYSPETGSYILPSKNPYDELDPMVKEKIPPTADDETLRQGYEISSALGSEPEEDVDDFIQGVKISDNPKLVAKEAAKTLRPQIRQLSRIAKSLPKGPERDKMRRKINKMLVRLASLEKLQRNPRADLKDIYTYRP